MPAPGCAGHSNPRPRSIHVLVWRRPRTGGRRAEGTDHPRHGPRGRRSAAGCRPGDVRGRDRAPARAREGAHPRGGRDRGCPSAAADGRGGRRPGAARARRADARSSTRSRDGVSCWPTTSCGGRAGPRRTSARAAPTTPTRWPGCRRCTPVTSRSRSSSRVATRRSDRRTRRSRTTRAGGTASSWAGRCRGTPPSPRSRSSSPGRELGLFHLVSYVRDGDRVFETYWTMRRGVQAMDYSYALMDLTVWGRQEDVGGIAGGMAAGLHQRPHRCRRTRVDAHGRVARAAPSASGLASMPGTTTTWPSATYHGGLDRLLPTSSPHPRGRHICSTSPRPSREAHPRPPGNDCLLPPTRLGSGETTGPHYGVRPSRPGCLSRRHLAGRT